MPGRRGHFANVDLGVEIGGKCLPMVAAIAIQNIQPANGAQLVLLQPHGKNGCHAGVKTTAQQRHQPGRLETILIGPLPVILELGHILGLVIGRIHIVGTRRQAGIHDRQILIGQRQVHHQPGPGRLDQGGQRRHILSVDGIGGNIHPGAALHRCGNRLALGHRAAGQMDAAEDRTIHRHLVHANRANPARADHQNLAHRYFSIIAHAGQTAGHSPAHIASLRHFSTGQHHLPVNPALQGA